MAGIAILKLVFVAATFFAGAFFAGLGILT